MAICWLGVYASSENLAWKTYVTNRVSVNIMIITSCKPMLMLCKRMGCHGFIDCYCTARQNAFIFLPHVQKMFDLARSTWNWSLQSCSFITK